MENVTLKIEEMKKDNSHYRRNKSYYECLSIANRSGFKVSNHNNDGTVEIILPIHMFSKMHMTVKTKHTVNK